MKTEIDALLARCRIETEGPVDLAARATTEAVGGVGKAALRAEVARLAPLQTKLAAEKRWAVLCVLQSMDAGGKDSTIRHVFKGIDPAGVRVTAFKAPSHDDLDHDFLRRAAPGLPRRGEIGIFNRSYYEEVLITRLHPEMLAAERIPEALKTETLWDGRLADIAAYEAYLARQGIAVLKFFLHISKEEQRLRFLRRLRRSDKIWKFDAADMAERERWDDYTVAYGEAIGATASRLAPWFVIPADRKPLARLLVATAVSHALEQIGPHFPEPDEAAQKAAEEAYRVLEAQP